MRSSRQPPWLARGLLERTLPEDVRDPILGDLLEVFERAKSARGMLRARLWYLGIALSLSTRFLRERLGERIAGRLGRDAPDLTPATYDASEFGSRANPTWARLEARRKRRLKMLAMFDAWRRDFVQAARSLLRAPVFTVVTVATLALAIGANTAIFSVVDDVLLAGLPFPEADRLVAIKGLAPGTDLEGEIGVPDELYVQYRESADRLEDIGMYSLFQSTTRVEDRVERLFGSPATASLFTTLGVRPVLGRLPTEEDTDQSVVISHWLWMDWFGGDPSVLDRTYFFANAQRTVIGVMPPDFRFPDERVALWVPLRINPAALTPGGFGLRAVARMRPGVDHAGLVTQLTPLSRRLLERFPGPAPYRRIIEQHRPLVRSLEEELVGPVRRPLWILMGAVAILLLMACANVANLFTVRAEARRQDLAVRRALGAGRGGLVRAQMAEALLLAALGGIGGALIAWAGVPLLVRAAPESIMSGWGGAPIPRLANANVDPFALMFTAGASVLAACLFGLAPAIRFSGSRLLENLRQAGRGMVGGRHLGRDALVVLQTASALVLLVGSALLVRSFLQLRSVDAGYDTKDIFTFQIAPDREELNDAASFARFHYAFMDRLAGLPGVESVGVVATLPLDEGAGEAFVHTERTEASGAEAPMLRITAAGGDYFRTMGIDVLRGRAFERSDEASPPLQPHRQPLRSRAALAGRGSDQSADAAV